MIQADDRALMVSDCRLPPGELGVWRLGIVAMILPSLSKPLGSCWQSFERDDGQSDTILLAHFRSRSRGRWAPLVRQAMESACQDRAACGSVARPSTPRTHGYTYTSRKQFGFGRQAARAARSNSPTTNATAVKDPKSAVGGRVVCKLIKCNNNARQSSLSASRLNITKPSTNPDDQQTLGRPLDSHHHHQNETRQVCASTSMSELYSAAEARRLGD